MELRFKHQTPNTKHQRSSKLQARGVGCGLELGNWAFFGVWSLVFGVSIPGFLWSLVFGIWFYPCSSVVSSGLSVQFTGAFSFHSLWAASHPDSDSIPLPGMPSEPFPLCRA